MLRIRPGKLDQAKAFVRIVSDSSNGLGILDDDHDKWSAGLEGTYGERGGVLSNGILCRQDKTTLIDGNTLAAITLMSAESDPVRWKRSRELS